VTDIRELPAKFGEYYLVVNQNPENIFAGYRHDGEYILKVTADSLELALSGLARLVRIMDEEQFHCY
jgi:hypothetical protein